MAVGVQLSLNFLISILSMLIPHPVAFPNSMVLVAPAFKDMLKDFIARLFPLYPSDEVNGYVVGAWLFTLI